MALRAGAAFVDILGNLAPIKAQMATGLQGTFASSGTNAAKSFSQGLKGGLKSSLSNLGAGVPKGGIGPLLGLGVAGGIAAGIKEAADQTADLAEEVEDLSEVTGASAEDASALAAVMRSMGVDVNSAARPFLNLSRVLEDGGKDLKAFFTERELAELRTGTLSEAVSTLSAEFQTLEGQQEENNFLIAAFGTRGAVAMRELLEATDGEIKKAIELAEAQGLIFSQKQLDDARDYRIAMRQLGDSWTGLKTKAGNAAIPAITNFTNNLNAGSTAVQEATEGNSNLGKAFGFVGELIKSGIPGIRVWTDDLFGAKDASKEFAAEELKTAESVDVLDRSLDQLRTTANDTSEDGKAAAKRLQDALTTAFEISSKASEEFQERLEGLVPALGETFSGVLTPDELTESIEEAADSVSAAADKVADAEKRLSEARQKVSDNQRFLSRTPDREKELADARRDVADAERDVADAKRDAADAQKELNEANAFEDAQSTDELRKTLEANTDLLENFANGLGAVRSRLMESGGSLSEIEEAFLGHLSDLGPAAIPLLRELGTISDKELGSLAGIFGDQIAAAKRAADLQFDKFPANFTEKVAAARLAAADELDGLIGKFEALPEGVDESQWDQKMKNLGLSIQIMADEGLIALTDIEDKMLETAVATDDPIERVRELKRLIDSLDGKTVTIQMLVDQGFVPTAPGGAADLILGSVPQRHSGGSVRAGGIYNVLPGEEIFTPSVDGVVTPVTNHNKTSNQTISIAKMEVRDYDDFERKLEQKQRMLSLTGGF